MTQILKCVVGLNEGCVLKLDGINHEGKLWLVVAWLVDENESLAMPARIVRFDDHPYQAHTPGIGLHQNIQLPIFEPDLRAGAHPHIQSEDLPQNVTIHVDELNDAWSPRYPY